MCPVCGTMDWDFIEVNRAECVNGHRWDQAPGIPGSFMRPCHPGDINDPERFPGEVREQHIDCIHYQQIEGNMVQVEKNDWFDYCTAEPDDETYE